VEGISGVWDGSRLRSLRGRVGLTLEQAAAQTGFSVSHLSNVERGARVTTDDVARSYLNLRQVVQPGAEVKPLRAARISQVQPVVPSDGGADDFGTRLMRLRLARGLTLAQLARDINVSKSFLGNLECGRRHPSPAVAASCEKRLSAGGALITLAATDRPVPRSPGAAGGVPAEPPGARELRAIAGLDPEFVADSGERRLLDIRRLAQLTRPGPLINDAACFAADAARAAQVVAADQRAALRLLAARAAEITGWLVEEAGHEATADRWTRTAALWSGFGGDQDMRGYRWERRALGALYRGRAAETVALGSVGGSG
jgi:transcriptional regulator with XRE-family HTH domain